MSVAERGQVVFDRKPPTTKLTQRMKLLWIQQNRISGTWARCSLKGCGKWRYLRYIADPLDIPDEWQCSMNNDMEQNSCRKPEPSNFKDILLIRLKFTAGSLVWVNSNKYPRWPGMVDDNPEKSQFYWLDFTKPYREASMYHVVFIDPNTDNVTRQWFTASELEPFRLTNSEETYSSQRLSKSVLLAREALNMNIHQRLDRFSFARLFKGHIKSFKQIFRAHGTPDGYVSENESDWTQTSTSSSDEDLHYADAHRNCASKQKNNSPAKKTLETDRSSGLRKRYSCKPTSRKPSYDKPNNSDGKINTTGTPYPEPSYHRYSDNIDTRLRKRNPSIAPDNYSEVSLMRRATSVARERASSVPPKNYSEVSPMRRATSGARERASSVPPGVHGKDSRRRSLSFPRGDHSERDSRMRQHLSVPTGSHSERDSRLRQHLSVPRGGYSERDSRMRQHLSVPRGSYSERDSRMRQHLSVPRGGYSERYSRMRKHLSVPRGGHSERDYRMRQHLSVPRGGHSERDSRMRHLSVPRGDHCERDSRMRQHLSVPTGGHSERDSWMRQHLSVPRGGHSERDSRMRQHLSVPTDDYSESNASQNFSTFFRYSEK